MSKNSSIDKGLTNINNKQISKSLPMQMFEIDGLTTLKKNFLYNFCIRSSLCPLISFFYYITWHLPVELIGCLRAKSS